MPAHIPPIAPPLIFQVFDRAKATTTGTPIQRKKVPTRDLI